MCSIFVTNREIDHKLDKVNRFLKLRGPDATNVYKRDGITFVHNLLTMTGDFTTQPFEDENVVCLYNGEIYNYLDFGTYNTDGECLIPLYRKFGKDFIKQLDGEFTVCLFDFEKKHLIISSDVFAIKPLWYCFTGRLFGISSYESALIESGFPNSVKLKANTTYVIDLENFRILDELSVYDFDLKQYKNSYDDWTAAFERSIKKRYITSKQKVFIGLSSGYDSGVIACELTKQNVDFHAYSTVGYEDVDVLTERHSLIKSPSKGFIYKKKKKEKRKAQSFIRENVEDFKFQIYSDTSDYNEFTRGIRSDGGSTGMAFISSIARENERRIYITGCGADEIFADYGFGGKKFYEHSNFGGLFPEDLRKVFPWASFYESSMVSYLMKEEYVSGAFGLEGRYPFIDKDVVQEFLWLECKLKNSNYKSVLYNYLKENNYPFKENEKVGFGM